MEAERRRSLPRGRKPLADCANTFSSSSSVPLKPSKSSIYSSSCSSASNKPLPKRASTTDIPPNLDNNALNPSSPRTPAVSTHSPKISSLHGTVDVEAKEPISVFYSRKRSSNERKDKGKEVADEGDSISSSLEKSDAVEIEKLPKALTVPLLKIKKQRPLSSEKDELKDPLPQEYIEEQKAYFKLIDEFQLSEEEVESADELD